MKTYTRRQQHKSPRHKTKEPPQMYRLGTISNIKLLAGLNRLCMTITLPSASAVVHKFGPRGESLTSQRIIKNKLINRDKHPRASDPITVPT